MTKDNPPVTVVQMQKAIISSVAKFLRKEGLEYNLSVSKLYDTGVDIQIPITGQQFLVSLRSFDTNPKNPEFDESERSIVRARDYKRVRKNLLRAERLAKTEAEVDA